tara:strand:+ start:5810 stop:6088 length:279 start_codon:yes stop_codon:yes gene_type:complete
MAFINIVTIIAFVYVSKLVGKVFLEDLKESNLIGPILTTVCAITISYHFATSEGQEYIAAAFVGFFIAASVNCYQKPARKKPATQRKNKVNP